MRHRRSITGLLGLLLAGGSISLAACASSGGNATVNSESPQTSVTAEATTSSAPATSSPSATKSSPPPSLRECLRRDGALDLNDDLVDLFGETVDAIEEAGGGGTVGAFVDDMQTFAKEYDKLGRAYKSSPDCGDDKWAMMTGDLGDALILVGDRMAVLTPASINSGDAREVQELVQAVSAVGNQFEVMTDYINKSG